ncbi:hypothetical protein MNU22_27440 [Pseudomonas aeruginosa]|nr:hypothetical protein [Pseudomonas aeruginosa]
MREAAVLAVDGKQLVGYVVLESEGGDWREAWPRTWRKACRNTWCRRSGWRWSGCR